MKTWRQIIITFKSAKIISQKIFNTYWRSASWLATKVQNLSCFSCNIMKMKKNRAEISIHCEHGMNPLTAIPWSKSSFDVPTWLCLFQTKLCRGDGLWKAAKIKYIKRYCILEADSAPSFVFCWQNMME